MSTDRYQCCTSSPKSPSDSSKACTIGANGAAGECISTGSCSSKGGKSTPGYCPNDPTDIQVSLVESIYRELELIALKCCTSSPKSPADSDKKCTVGANGPAGECISTGSCSSRGGTSKPGYCPNDPTDIQVSELPVSTCASVTRTNSS
jgi:hypothetical protein